MLHETTLFASTAAALTSHLMARSLFHFHHTRHRVWRVGARLLHQGERLAKREDVCVETTCRCSSWTAALLDFGTIHTSALCFSHIALHTHHACLISPAHTAPLPGPEEHYYAPPCQSILLALLRVASCEPASLRPSGEGRAAKMDKGFAILEAFRFLHAPCGGSSWLQRCVPSRQTETNTRTASSSER